MTTYTEIPDDVLDRLEQRWPHLSPLIGNLRAMRASGASRASRHQVAKALAHAALECDVSCLTPAEVWGLGHCCRPVEAGGYQVEVEAR